MFKRNKLFLAALLLSPLSLSAYEFMKDYLDYKDERPLPTVANDLIYGDGSNELTTQINNSGNLQANKPIQGTILVTHDDNHAIDVSSFRIGDKHLEVAFVQEMLISPSSKISVSIYSFGLEGMPAGSYTLPAINVIVGGKRIQALPLIIQIPQ